MISFREAQAAWDNMRPPDDEFPTVPEELILQICAEWAEDPPNWMREMADSYWIEKWKENKRGR